MSGKEGKRRKHEDRISQLPDDILIPIISHLNVREAADTCILTPRWRYLYTYTTRLHFPPFETKYITFPDMDQDLIRSFPHHINTINHVLDSHRGNRIKEFRVYTHSLKGATINKWFEFALSKDVEILHIHMEIGITDDHNRDAEGHYPLPENLNLMGETLICLKELSLLGIDVNDGEIQLLLHKFPLLESLSIKGSSSLRHVSIVGHSSSQLKHLEISDVRYFDQLIEIDIDNLVNLVSLWFFKLAFSLNIKNVPKLIEFSMCDDYRCTSARILSGMPSSIHHQLQTLKIFTYPSWTKEYEQRMPLQINGLKNLELQHRVDNFDKACCFDPFYIIRACPSLENLEIKFSSDILCFMKVNEYYEEYTVFDGSAKKLCPDLKKMKIFGYMGSSSELKFVFSILKNVNILEELVVETRVVNKKNKKLAMEHAQRYFGPRAIKMYWGHFMEVITQSTHNRLKFQVQNWLYVTKIGTTQNWLYALPREIPFTIRPSIPITTQIPTHLFG